MHSSVSKVHATGMNKTNGESVTTSFKFMLLCTMFSVHIFNWFQFWESFIVFRAGTPGSSIVHDIFRLFIVQENHSDGMVWVRWYRKPTNKKNLWLWNPRLDCCYNLLRISLNMCLSYRAHLYKSQYAIDSLNESNYFALSFTITLQIRCCQFVFFPLLFSPSILRIARVPNLDVCIRFFFLQHLVRVVVVSLRSRFVEMSTSQYINKYRNSFTIKTPTKQYESWFFLWNGIRLRSFFVGNERLIKNDITIK